MIRIPPIPRKGCLNSCEFERPKRFRQILSARFINKRPLNINMMLCGINKRTTSFSPLKIRGFTTSSKKREKDMLKVWLFVYQLSTTWKYHIGVAWGILFSQFLHADAKHAKEGDSNGLLIWFSLSTYRHHLMICRKWGLCVGMKLAGNHLMRESAGDIATPFRHHQGFLRARAGGLMTLPLGMAQTEA